ncbi:velvet factor-domain-containing protein [Fennellomyces sp. T-0311]|nr:velvet factor-domain-containing protein [Fennellomyces sp. T-0311]
MNIDNVLPSELPSHTCHDTRYRLVIVQQPIHARCCGFGEKDRRLIDPPIILQLFVVAPNGSLVKATNADSELYVVHCDLYCESKKQNRSIVFLPSSVAPEQKRKKIDGMVEEQIISLRTPKSVRNLTGSLTANATPLTNERGEPGIYFVFHDLSVRTDGRFTLKFMFMDLAAGDPRTMAASVSAEVFSDSFTVYTAKKFPGMTESTPLSRAFARQGVKIITRKEASYTRASDKFYKMPLPPPQPLPTCSSSSKGKDRDKLKLSIASITHPIDVEAYKSPLPFQTPTIASSSGSSGSSRDKGRLAIANFLASASRDPPR